ncbi:MAG TPA: hypothetical protein PKO46_21935, partial [Sedimentisphaerales bacterium]|nr:hypothetical protein [Sedimentisphaerales bacterium]
RSYGSLCLQQLLQGTLSYRIWGSRGVGDDEEQRIWGIYDAQPPDMRRGMLERFRASARFDAGIAEEAACRR